MATDTSPPDNIGPGTILNGTYRIERLIGSGGMGDVYLATNIELDEQDAVKVIKEQWAAEPKIASLLRKEAKTLRLLVAPEVALFRACATDPDLNALYLVTEYVAGQSLVNRINGLPTPVADVLTLLKRVATGLKAAHDLNIVHRDISPDNILLPERRFDLAKIIDFGIAKDLAPDAETVIGEGFAGRWDYSAPELFSAGQKPVGPWSDIYSLGLVALALAKGHPADMGSTMPSAYAARQREVDLEGVPDALRPLLADMLHPDYRERVQSMGELLRLIKAIDAGPRPAPAAAPPGEALDETLLAETVPDAAIPATLSANQAETVAAVSHSPPSAPPPSPPAAAKPAPRRSIVPIAIGGFAAVLLPLGLWLSWPGNDAEPTPGPTGSTVLAPAAEPVTNTAAAPQTAAAPPKSGFRYAPQDGPIDVPLKMVGRWGVKRQYPAVPDCAGAMLISRLPGAISVIPAPGMPGTKEEIVSSHGPDQVATGTRIFSLQTDDLLFVTRTGATRTMQSYVRCS